MWAGFKWRIPVPSEKKIVIIFLLSAVALCLAADSGKTDSAALLKCVKEAIKKAGEEGIPAKEAKAKLPYDDTHMNAILFAAQDYFAQPVARALNANLQFKPHYRTPAETTSIIRRPANPNSRHHTLGDDTVTVETKQNKNNQKVIDGYVIAGGDVEAVRQIGSVCFLLQEAFKDTPLNTKNARFYCPALKSLYTLLEYLPKFADRYIEIEGYRWLYEARLSEAEAKRKELLLIQKEWLAEMAALRKAQKEEH